MWPSELPKKRLCFYDLETTGFKATYRHPIQVAIKTVETDGSQSNYCAYLQCPVNVPEDIVILTSITDELLKKEGRPPKEVWTKVHELISVPDTMLISHNGLRFDNAFMNVWLEKFDYPPLDHVWTFDIASQFKGHLTQSPMGKNESFNVYHHGLRYVGGSTVEWSLEDLCDYYGIEKDQDFHDAMADVTYVHAIFDKQMDDHKNLLPVNNERLSDKNKLYRWKKDNEWLLKPRRSSSYRKYRKPFAYPRKRF